MGYEEDMQRNGWDARKKYDRFLWMTQTSLDNGNACLERENLSEAYGHLTSAQHYRSTLTQLESFFEEDETESVLTVDQRIERLKALIEKPDSNSTDKEK